MFPSYFSTYTFSSLRDFCFLHTIIMLHQFISYKVEGVEREKEELSYTMQR